MVLKFIDLARAGMKWYYIRSIKWLIAIEVRIKNSKVEVIIIFDS